MQTVHHLPIIIGMTTEDLARLLQNVIRIGTVAHIDHAARRVRVSTDGLLTNWVKWHTARAGNSRTWDPPSVGEQVILLAPGGDLSGAFVLAALDSSQNPPPSTSADKVVRIMPDGALFEYDHAAKELRINVPGRIRITASQITIDGPVTQSGGDLSSNGIVLHTHVHGDVAPGGATTGEPQ